jgi:hypothetical protein
MKALLLALILLTLATNSFGQAYSSAVNIVTVHSENQRFYLRSIPFDNESTSLRGRTSVFEVGNPIPLYSFEVGFDSDLQMNNALVLSNNGETILFAITFYENEEKEGLRRINIYRKGQLVKSLTKGQITGCNESEEDCDLV